MPLIMPRVLQMPTHNYSPVLISHDLFFVHMAEGSGAGSAAWLCRSDVPASAHMVMSEDGTLVWQLVPLKFKAWAQCAFNGRGISLEIPGFTRQGIPETRWRAAALIVAWHCREYGIPPLWARGGQGRGVCQHHDLGAAGGGHVDCSDIGSPTWLAFMAMVQQAFDALGAGALPAFALNGLPDPHEIVLPPAHVTPEPSHEGAARAHADDEQTPHDTASGFAKGSMRDLQWRLRFAGANPMLGLDGIEGDATHRAFGVFQRANGLPVTNDVNPATLAKLYAIAA